MKLLDLLAKLGILRVGAKKATYTSAKDRPAEFMMDGVYNAERDLVTKKDFTRTPEKPKAQK
ncbi:MAG: hypothetical protein U1A06_04870 [Hoeflea sp.]|uniref:hypothetical protein n=1 Tax=Hoeflea sp. TaxID=1940281 RepID=UPI00273114EE|nr:hypothetical protein [Hoeflea sp.]MDP2119499.1 hypothetical protein [Hoeflea sp.]MDZ7600688.1 hypothetical protein [Hoeflea sp.]